jgi:hypothetical protein
VQSFPMESGTLVVGEGRRWLTRLTLVRGEKCATVPVTWLMGAAEAQQRIWHAVMSTSPTPPLSETELLG